MNIFGTNAICLKNLSVHQSRHDIKVWRNDRRSHHGVTFRLCGHSHFLFEDGKTIESQKGTLLFIPQGVGYVQQSLEASEFICFHFNSEELLGCKPFVLKPLDDRNFRYLFNRLWEAWKENPETSSIGAMVITYKIIEAIITESETQLAGSSSHALLQALKYMHRNFAEPGLTIANCAASGDISEIYLRRLVRKYFGKSPGQYLCDFRIEHAKNLLSTGYYTIMEVAARSGFSTPSYFCHVFKAQTGFSPLEFTKNL
jgi:AraC-like DNA-binding protein